MDRWTLTKRLFISSFEIYNTMQMVFPTVHQCSDAVASFCALQTKCCWDLQEGSVIQFPVYLGLLVILRLVNKSAEELKFSSCHLWGWCKRSIIDRLLSPRRAVCCLLSAVVCTSKAQFRRRVKSTAMPKITGLAPNSFLFPAPISWISSESVWSVGTTRVITESSRFSNENISIPYVAWFLWLIANVQQMHFTAVMHHITWLRF